MGLSKTTTGLNILQDELKIERTSPEDKIIGVGKPKCWQIYSLQ